MRAGLEIGHWLRSRPRGNIAYLAVVTLLTVGVFLWRPRVAMPKMGIDPSWSLAMNHIVVEKMRLGQQVTFTFGPLSRLYTSQYHPQLFLGHCLVAALLSVLYVCLLHRLVSISFQSTVVKIILMLLLALLSSVDDVFWYSFAPLGLVAILVHRPNRDDAFEAFFWLGMAILALIKSSFGVSASFVWLLEIILCVITRTRRWALLAFPVSGLLIWVFEGQSVTALPEFARNTLAIGSGYGEAMGLPLRSLSFLWGFWLILGSAALLLLQTLTRRGYGDWRLLPVLSYLMLAWSLFKGGFMRDYVQTGVIGAFVMAASIWIACWRDLRGLFGRVVLAISVLASLAFTHVLSELYFSQNAFAFLFAQGKATGQRILVNFQDLRQGGREQAYDAALTAIRKRARLPPLAGSVDVYRVNQALLFAYGMTWNPRLVFQSYAAYTPELIEQNRRHLQGATSPDNVILDLGTPDRHYPTLDDGTSLLEILSRYRVTSLPKDLAILGKRAQPNPFHFEHTRTITGAFDAVIQVPGSEARLLWVWLDFEKTTAGKAASLLYRAPILTFEVRVASGRSHRYRMVPGMSHSGFLLSPLVNDVALFAFLNDSSAEPAPPAAQVVGMQLQIEPGFEWMYQSKIAVKLAEVVFDAPDRSQVFDAEYVARATARRWPKGKR
jgi:hypothetical protein